MHDSLSAQAVSQEPQFPASSSRLTQASRHAELGSSQAQKPETQLLPASQLEPSGGSVERVDGLPPLAARSAQCNTCRTQTQLLVVRFINDPWPPMPTGGRRQRSWLVVLALAAVRRSSSFASSAASS